MNEITVNQRQDRAFRAVLHPHRSLGPRGFLILMGLIGGVSFAVGFAFLLIGAWPVLGFFGLDVALIYGAFKLNYRDGRAHEIVELTPEVLTLTRVDPNGRSTSVDFNPHWVRVLLAERADGRTDLKLTSHGREVSFARLLNDDERRSFAEALSAAITGVRTNPTA